MPVYLVSAKVSNYSHKRQHNSGRETAFVLRETPCTVCFLSHHLRIRGLSMARPAHKMSCRRTLTSSWKCNKILAADVDCIAKLPDRWCNAWEHYPIHPVFDTAALYFTTCFWAIFRPVNPLNEAGWQAISNYAIALPCTKISHKPVTGAIPTYLDAVPFAFLHVPCIFNHTICGSI